MLKSRRKENVDFRKYVSYLWALVAETLVKVNNIHQRRAFHENCEMARGKNSGMCGSAHL